MTDYLYHGSKVKGIEILKANSKLHNSDIDVVYLTGSIPYALFYIWDEKRTGYDGKHVTARIKNGTVYYEEQFPNQMEEFYKNVSGFVYCVPNDGFEPVDDRECMFYSTDDAKPEKTVFIQDVYEELLKYEKSEELKVLRYNEQSAKRQNELIDMITTVILRNDFYKKNKQKARFYKKYFLKAWEQAWKK